MSVLLMASSIGMIIIALALGISTIRLANELTNESKLKSRKIWRLERRAIDTPQKVIGEIARVISEFNNTPTEQEKTGNKPTLFFDIAGHVARADLYWYPQGWAFTTGGLNEKNQMTVDVCDYEELTKMLSVVRTIINEWEESNENH